MDDAGLAAMLRSALGTRLTIKRAAFDAELAARIEALADPVVALAGGARLSIHPTPALTAIDVDAGAATASGGPKAAAQRALNRAILPALAAEIRLRNLSGAILVDFAGLPARRREALTPELGHGSGVRSVAAAAAGFTRLGLAEIVRSRIHPPLHEMLSGPYAAGLAALRQAAAELAANPASLAGQSLSLHAAPAIITALEADPAQNGEFDFTSLPIGSYTVTVTAEDFEPMQQEVIVKSDTSPVLHCELNVAGIKQSVAILENPVEATTQSVTPTTMVDREDIRETPGADRSNGMEMITDYVPAAYVTHDMLHMRGGHQVEFLIDGVPIPNTNIASNLGPQIDPKDIDELEVFRGSYDADYGDRTYGIFNIVPRTGFERNNECELVLSFGNFYQTNDQISCGGHTDRFAYYLSANGNRSNYGLQTPIAQVFHDADNGYGGFGSFIFNPNPRNQFRLVTSLRQDYYQIPIDPDPNSSGNQILASSGNSPSYGLRDGEREPDGYVVFSWVRTFNRNLVLTVSPFYHYNGADYHGGPNDYPVISTVTQTANYGGGQVGIERGLLEKRPGGGSVWVRPASVQLLQQPVYRRQPELPSLIGWRFGRGRRAIH